MTNIINIPQKCIETDSVAYLKNQPTSHPVTRRVDTIVRHKSHVIYKLFGKRAMVSYNLYELVHCSLKYIYFVNFLLTNLRAIKI